MVVIWHCVFSGPKRLAPALCDEFTAARMPAELDRATRTFGSGGSRGQGEPSTRFHQIAGPEIVYQDPRPLIARHTAKSAKAARTPRDVGGEFPVVDDVQAGDEYIVTDTEGRAVWADPEPVLDDDGQPLLAPPTVLDDHGPVWDDSEEMIEILTDDIDRAVTVAAAHEFRLRLHSDSQFASIDEAAAVEAHTRLGAR